MRSATYAAITPAVAHAFVATFVLVNAGPTKSRARGVFIGASGPSAFDVNVDAARPDVDSLSQLNRALRVSGTDLSSRAQTADSDRGA